MIARVLNILLQNCSKSVGKDNYFREEIWVNSDFFVREALLLINANEKCIYIDKMSQIKRSKTVDLGAPLEWGKLVPLTPGLPTHELSDPVIVIGRLKDCDIQINDKRLSGKHCKL